MCLQAMEKNIKKIVRKYLNENDLDGIFDVNNFLKNLDFIFERVFGK